MWCDNLPKMLTATADGDSISRGLGSVPGCDTKTERRTDRITIARMRKEVTHYNILVCLQHWLKNKHFICESIYTVKSAKPQNAFSLAIPTVSYKSKQDHQVLLKAKYCQQAMTVKHFVNPGRLVQAVSCTQTTHVALTLIFNRLLEIVKAHVHAKFHQAMCSGSWAIVLTKEKLSDDVKNNTAIASMGSNQRFITG